MSNIAGPSGTAGLLNNQRRDQLILPSGCYLSVPYLNGLQVLGFCLAFFGLLSCLLGLLDIVIIPAVFSVENDHLPIRLGLANAFGLSIFCGLLIIASGAMALRTMISGRFTSLRKFYLSLWINLLLGIAYWCCFVWAICKGLLTLSEFTKKTSNALLVTRIFTGTNVGLSFVPNLTGIALYWKPVMSVCCGSYDFPVPRSQSAGRFSQLSAAFHSPRSQLRRTRLHHGDESSSDGLSTSDVAPLHL